MKPENQGNRIIADNRYARHEYFITDVYEAGLVLTGTEVKAARNGKVALKDGWAEVRNGEAWLEGVHISEYSHGNIENHKPVHARKLLLHKQEILKLIGKTREKGLTLIPLKMYLKEGRIKCEIGLAKGKKLHDKRETLKTREQEAEARSAMKARRYQ
ncbi:SsrA-binding protein SmpB [Bryobacter aggregatus]|uniref:SsrA-binding protein SmpB n=1 Tax=Bryobacter aggregatus TaxID=360054 RepID=UPI0004E1A815|nr:SsrA-binding protein SmpB [Bryobacter aggregatus]